MTPKPKHTPGPWKAQRDCYIYAWSCDPLARVFTYNAKDSISNEEAYYNSRLIAAAPELLEALKAVKAEYDREELLIDSGVLTALRDAIAKAEGRGK